MGAKQKGFGKKKHTNFKIALDKRTLNKSLKSTESRKTIGESLESSNLGRATVHHLESSETVTSKQIIIEEMYVDDWGSIEPLKSSDEQNVQQLVTLDEMNFDLFKEEVYCDNLIDDLQESDDTHNEFQVLDLHKQRVYVSEHGNNPSETLGEHKDYMLSSDENSEFENDIGNKHIYSEEDLLQDEMDGPEESENTEIPSGRRIVDIYSFFESVQRLNSHSHNNNCNFSNMRFVKEFRQGLNSIFTFSCDVCQYSGVIKSNPPSNQQLEVNYSSVLGAYAVGIGYYQCQEFFGTMDVPFMAVTTFDKRQKLVQNYVKQLSEKLKNEAMAKEKQIAVEKNEVDVNGTPKIAGYADGCYPKRSYRTHYDSLSGTACIIGLNTKKVIWHGVKNKYCRTCALNKDGQPKEHTCNRNFTGPSTGIESQLLLEAFESSEKCHGVRYHKLIADGDSKTYKVIDEAKIYRNPTLKVEKIECILHLYRCAMGLLLKVKGLSSTDAERLLIGIKCAVKHWIESGLSDTEKIENIRKDILNATHHVFGDHIKCNSYFCDKEKHKNDTNCIPIMKKNGIYNNIMHALARLLENARSLLYNLNTNFPEQFNSIVAKHLGAKRINFCTGLSYEGRVDCAVISFNTGRLVSHVRKFVLNETEVNQNTIIYKIESTRLKRRENPTKPGYLRKKKKVCLQDENYGTHTSQRPDMSPEVFEFMKNLHLDSILEQQKDRTNIELKTRSEADSNFREQIQEDILTAEKFGKICRVAQDDDFPNLVESIRYASETTGNTKEIKRGRIFENTAIELLSDILKINIESCGVFIDEKYAFLGAHPTGVIEKNAIVLIKCPHLAFKMDINEAVEKRKITFWSMSRKNKNDKNATRQVVAVNKKHDWYFEVQGLLHITRRQYCIFAVWSGHDETSKCMKYEYIYSEEELWKNQMEIKLVKFYYDHLLPEVINPRRGRGMPIRGVKEKPQKKSSNSVQIQLDSAVDQQDLDGENLMDGEDDAGHDVNDKSLQASACDNDKRNLDKNTTHCSMLGNSPLKGDKNTTHCFKLPIRGGKEKPGKKSSNSMRDQLVSLVDQQDIDGENLMDGEDDDGHDVNDRSLQAPTCDKRNLYPLTGDKSTTHSFKLRIRGGTEKPRKKSINSMHDQLGSLVYQQDLEGENLMDGEDDAGHDLNDRSLQAATCDKGNMDKNTTHCSMLGNNPLKGDKNTTRSSMLGEKNVFSRPKGLRNKKRFY